MGFFKAADDDEDRRIVRYTADFQRIQGLPRRSHTDEEQAYIASELTAALKTRVGQMTLRPKQALALHDLGTYNGLVAVMRVGSGKTIVSLLAPVVLDPEPLRPLLILPASLIQKTKDDHERLRKHWRVATNMPYMSYQALGRIDGSTYLEETWQPDFIVLDEAHMAKNLKAGVTRRLARYMKANPNTRVAVMSGTLFKASIKDAAHLLRWALKDGAPVPTSNNEVEEWANAIDDENRVSGLQRYGAGALLDLAGLEDKELLRSRQITQITAARRGFQKRLKETPGVVDTGSDQVDCSLNIFGIKYDTSAQTDAHFTKLRTESLTPDDWLLCEAIEVWAHAKQLALGFHMVWDPRPPDEWRVRRKLWHQFVREQLKKHSHGRLTLDTEAEVAGACKSGALDAETFNAWDAIRPSFKPRSKALWHDDSALDVCQAWGKKHLGIVWTEHVFFAHELARRTGWTYFGEGGLSADGQDLTKYGDDINDGNAKPRTIIASIRANATGRNLQGWRDNLVTSWPTEAALCEQMLGRTHRDGQTADDVEVSMLVGCWEHMDAWEKSNSLARATQDTTGTNQKLLIATAVMPPVSHLTGERWQKTTDED